MKLAYLWLLCVIYMTCVQFVTGDGDWPNPHDDNEGHADGSYSAHCTSYCNIYGYYQPPKTCLSPAFPVYCCGDENSRFCCLNANYSVGERYPDVSSCPNSSWWFYHWRGIIGLMGSLVAVLMTSACCYYCCMAIFRDKVRFKRRRQQIPAVSADIEQEARPRPQPMFNPESPYAFTPPDYNSLPKQPPDYTEIMQAYANTGFVNDEDNAMRPTHPHEPPPCYDAPSNDTAPHQGHLRTHEENSVHGESQDSQK